MKRIEIKKNKHQLGNEDIGWSELADLLVLADSLRELNGDKWFQDFVERESNV